MFYSKSTGGFYDADIHGDNIPADAVEITATEHMDLIAGQSSGQCIVADAGGRPMLVAAPLPSADEVAAVLRADLLGQIIVLEAQQARPVREITTAIASGLPAPAFAVSRLAEIDAQIAALRARLP